MSGEYSQKLSYTIFLFFPFSLLDCRLYAGQSYSTHVRLWWLVIVNIGRIKKGIIFEQHIFTVQVQGNTTENSYVYGHFARDATTDDSIQESSSLFLSHFTHQVKEKPSPISSFVRAHEGKSESFSSTCYRLAMKSLNSLPYIISTTYLNVRYTLDRDNIHILWFEIFKESP
jgi:hypothetical protein